MVRASISSSLLISAAALALAACGDDSTPPPSDSGNDGTTTNAGTTSDPPTTSTDPTTNGQTSGQDTTNGGDTTDGDDSGTTASEVVCGDGTVGSDELCDDGNTDDGDGCSTDCMPEAGWTCDDATPTVCASICGDAMVVGDEQCDDGDEDDTDDCTTACLDAMCGDGFVWAGVETCDDGGTDPGDGCDAVCQAEGIAGIPLNAQVCDRGVPMRCFHAMFVAPAGGFSGNLYGISLDGVNTVDLGPLGTAVTGMAFHPDGTLYAVSPTNGELGTIETATATYTTVGNTVEAGGAAHFNIPDITFMGDQLFGWTENGDDIVMIDTATAVVTRISSPQDSLHTALAYNSATDELLLAPQGSFAGLFTVDEFGAVTAGPNLGGSNTAVRGMSYFDGLLYGMDVGIGGGGGDLVTYDPMTGAANVIAPVPDVNIDSAAVYDPDNVAAP